VSDEIDYEAEYASLYQAVLDAGLHIIDGPKGREVQMPLDSRIRELEDRLHERDLAVAALAQQLADRDARMSKLEAFVKEVRKVLDYEDWHPSEWHRFLRHSIPSAAAEGGGA
jgi:uncharacterized coiled-coil protein SlyX